MPISVGNIISRAFQIVINNRVFWVLGLLLTLFSSTISFSVNQNPFNFSRNPNALSEAAGSSALMGCLAFLLAIVFFILRAAIEGGLIAAADQTERGTTPTFQEAWQAGRAKMWPIVGLNLILVALAVVVGIIVFIVTLLVLGAAVASIFTTISSSLEQPGVTPPPTPNIGPSLGVFFLCLCGLILLFIPVAVALGVTVQFGERAIVLDNQSVGQAWGTGWRLMRANLGNVIVLLLAQFGVLIGVGIVDALISFPVGALMLGVSLNSSGAVATLIGIVVGIFLWAVSGLIGALPGAWASSCWTLLYRAATVPVGQGTGGAALYPGPVPPQGPYGGYSPTNPYGQPPPTPPGGYTAPGQYPGGYAPPPTPPGGYTTPGQYPGGYTPGQYPAPPPPPPPPGYGAPTTPLYPSPPAPPAPGYAPPTTPMYPPPGAPAPGSAPPSQPLTGVGRWDNMPGSGGQGSTNPYGPPPGPLDETGEPENR